MLPVIGMTGFAIALGLLGLFLTPDSNGSYTALSLSDRLRVAVKKATPKAQPSASYNPIETDAAGNYASPKQKVKIKPFGKDHDLSRSDAIRCRDDFAFPTFGIS